METELRRELLVLSIKLEEIKKIKILKALLKFLNALMCWCGKLKRMMIFRMTFSECSVISLICLKRPYLRMEKVMYLNRTSQLR